MGVTHVSNGDGSVTQFDADTGQELVTFPDPDGSFTRDHLEPAATSAATPAPAGSNAERTFARAMELSPARQTVTPDAPVTVSPEAPATEFSAALSPPVQPSATPDAGAGIRPAPLPIAGQETSGLSAEDRATREGMRQSVIGSEEQANASQTQAEQDAAAARETRVQNESDRALGRYATDLQLHELAKQKVLEAEQFAKTARETPIDPGQALAGNKFFYAIMAGVGASLSNFGSALLGQRGQQDTNLVDDIVNDSVQQQIADRKLKVEGAQDALGNARSDELQLRIQANASLEKWFESRAAVEQSPEVRAALKAHADQRSAAIAKDSMALAEAGYNHVVQHQAVPKPVKGGPAVTPTEAQAIMKKHNVDQKTLVDYTKQRVKTGADQVIASADNALDTVNKLSQGKDVPGVGTWDKFATAWANDPDGQAVQQVLGVTQAQFLHALSGASATDAEAKRLFGIITGPGWRPDQTTLTRGLQIVKGIAQSQLDTLNNGYSDASDAYEEIHGLRSGRRKLSASDADGLTEQRKRGKSESDAAAPAPAATAAPARGADPVRAVREKGFNRALNDFLDVGGDGSLAPGSPL